MSLHYQPYKHVPLCRLFVFPVSKG